MPVFFRSLLCLYPNAYRARFEEEMLSVLIDRRADLDPGAFARILFLARESGGLVLGALREHVRNVRVFQEFPISQRRRPIMRSDFRFPKSTVTLMLVILAAVIYTIEKAKSLQYVLPSSSPAFGPVEPTHVAIVPTFFLALAVVLSCAALGWAIVFAFRRSGLHRLSNLDTSVGHHPKPTLTQ
jgi:hypothetical protein